MKTIGIDLESCVKKGLLKFHAVRSTFYGLETHLVQMQKLIDEFKPASVVVDPITNLIAAGDQNDVKSMLTRLIDYLKAKQITTVFTNLNPL